MPGLVQIKCVDDKIQLWLDLLVYIYTGATAEYLINFTTMHWKIMKFQVEHQNAATRALHHMIGIIIISK